MYCSISPLAVGCRWWEVAGWDTPPPIRALMDDITTITDAAPHSCRLFLKRTTDEAVIPSICGRMFIFVCASSNL